MGLEDFSMPLEGLRLYYALPGLMHTTSSTGGFDLKVFYKKLVFIKKVYIFLKIYVIIAQFFYQKIDVVKYQKGIVMLLKYYENKMV